MYSQYVADKSESALLSKSVEACGELLNNGHVESVSHSFCYFTLCKIASFSSKCTHLIS